MIKAQLMSYPIADVKPTLNSPPHPKHNYSAFLLIFNPFKKLNQWFRSLLLCFIMATALAYQSF